jgi:hypothetical protein
MSKRSLHPFTCGNRAVIWRDGAWWIVCATCGGETSRAFPTKYQAVRACLNQPDNPCRECGAN